MSERPYSHTFFDAQVEPAARTAAHGTDQSLNLLDAVRPATGPAPTDQTSTSPARTDQISTGPAPADQTSPGPAPTDQTSTSSAPTDQISTSAALADRTAKTRPDAIPGSANVVQELTALLKFLPDGQAVDPQSVLKSLPDSGVTGSVQQLLNGATSIVRNGDHVQLKRDSALHVPIGRSIIEGNASVDSLNFGNIAFDLAPDGKSLKNIQGATLDVSAFGGAKAVAIRELSSAPSTNGSTAITAQIENPLPSGARDILQMPAQVPLTIESNGGQFTIPNTSDILYSAAKTSGGTLPGMLFRDTVANAGDIALFAEQHPKWMHDVISPMWQEVKKQANKPTPPQTSADNGRTADRAQPAEQAKPSDVQTQTEPVPEKITKGGDYHQTLKIDGQDRNYLLHVPANYDGAKPIPILVMLHGRGQDGQDFANRSHLNDKADKQGFAVAYPDAEKWLGIKQLSAWDAHNGLVPPGSHADDVGFLRSIIDKSQSQLSVDPKRIYMAGLSSGGMMTYLAATELSDKLAAVAVISGAMSGKEPKPKSPLSIISTHGTNDDVIPIDGLAGVPPILTEAGIPTFKTPEFATEFWKRQDGISGPGTVETNGDITRKHFVNKKNGTAVDELTLKGSSHVPEDRFKVLDEVWNFLAAHPKVSGSVAPSDDPKVLKDNGPNPLKHIVDDIKSRGADGIATDLGAIYQQSSALPDGSINPSKMLGTVEAKTGVKLSDPVTGFIRETTDVSKTGNHIQFKTNQPTNFGVDSSFGIGSVKSVSVDNLGFDLDTLNGHPRLSNIKGLTINLSAMGQSLSTKLNDFSDRVDAQGRHTYRFELENPLPGPLKTIMMASDKVNVGVQVDNEGNIKVANDKEIKNDLLGVNPITRGFIDEANDFTQLWQKPSLATGFSAAKDLGITVGLTWLTGRVRPLAAPLGFLAAPAVVHFIDDKIQ